MDLERLKSVFGRWGRRGKDQMGLDPQTELVRFDQVVEYRLLLLQIRHRSDGYGLSRQAIDLQAAVFDMSRSPHFKDNPLVLMRLGQWFGERGHFAEALFLQSRALSLYPLVALREPDFQLETVRARLLHTMETASLPDSSLLERDIEAKLTDRLVENIGAYLNRYPSDRQMHEVFTQLQPVPQSTS